MSDTPTYSSAGICSTCGKHVEKRYGGEGRYPPECIDCWIAGQEAERKANNEKANA